MQVCMIDTLDGETSLKVFGGIAEGEVFGEDVCGVPYYS